MLGVRRDKHYVRDYPKQICQGCGERGHHITKCRKTDNAAMAVHMLGRTSMDDDYPAYSEAVLEAYTTLKIKTDKCLVSIEKERAINQMGDDLWRLDTRATCHFVYDPRSLEDYAECSRALRCAVGNPFPIVGTVTLLNSF